MRYASQEFFENQFEPQERRWSVLFQLTDSVEITYDNAEEVIFEILAKCGVDKKYVIVNSMYLMWLLDPGYETILISIVIAAVVIILSVIVIYNIFQVGIVQNIKEYGKIRALERRKTDAQADSPGRAFSGCIRHSCRHSGRVCHCMGKL